MPPPWQHEVVVSFVPYIQEPTKGGNWEKEHKKGPEVLQLLFLDGQFSANAQQHWKSKDDNQPETFQPKKVIVLTDE